MPCLTFFCKFGLIFSIVAVYHASWNDNTLFPNEVRATSIGKCQGIARAITILAPQLSELEKPLPVMFMSVLIALAVLVTLTFEDDVFEEEKQLLNPI